MQANSFKAARLLGSFLAVLGFASTAAAQEAVAGAGASAPSSVSRSVVDAFLSMTMAQWAILLGLVLALGWVVGYFVFAASLERQGPSRAGRFGLFVGLVVALGLNLIVPFVAHKPIPVLLTGGSGSRNSDAGSATAPSNEGGGSIANPAGDF